jgi:hypothetical protein
MTNEEMLKQDLERAVKELEIDGSNTKQKVKYLLEECLEVYFKPKKYLTFNEAIKEFETDKVYKVKLNESDYIVYKRLNLFGDKEIILESNGAGCYKFNEFLSNDRQFFNDLHLELVEE